MELRNIRTFLEVADCGSFSRAAERLGYSQSAVTVQIKQLERELDARLFDRMPQGAVLTAPGTAFAFHAREIAREAEAARAAARLDSNEPADWTGTLRIGASESILHALLPDALERFHARCPRVRTRVSTGTRPELVAGLRGNELDLFLTMERPICAPDLVRETIRAEEVVFAAAPSLLDMPDGADAPLSLDELVKLPFVLTEPGESYRRELDRLLEEHGRHIDPFAEMGSTAALLDLARRGAGVAFVPSFCCARSIASGELYALKTSLEPVHVELQLLYHKDKWLAPYMQAFCTLIRMIASPARPAS